ncbi:hypothetical protein [Ferrimonas pelagia]|uniref:Lipoprotein n=1 Tax=Ferrimonas pelagia TaxID=1177826 RepID=A0ABP9EIB4_9GAMM
MNAIKPVVSLVTLLVLGGCASAVKPEAGFTFDKANYQAEVAVIMDASASTQTLQRYARQQARVAGNYMNCDGMYVDAAFDTQGLPQRLDDGRQRLTMQVRCGQ